MSDTEPLRVALIGAGNIADELIDQLQRSDGAEVVGAWDRAAIRDAGGWDMVLCELNRSADIVVEAASQDAVRSYAHTVIGSGLDLLVLSIGALSDEALRTAVSAGPGRLLLSTGAIAGIDHLRAMRVVGGFRSVTIESRKLPGSLRQPWMDADLLNRLDRATAPIELMTGSAAEIATAFPTSANVAAAVAIATDSWDRMTATILADPAATMTSHIITARNAAGSCRLEVCNQPSTLRPSSSLITVFSIVRAIQDLAYRSGRAPSPSTMTFV